MANEIKNLSHAGLVCTFDADPAVPIIQASWGLDAAAGITREAALGIGIYSMRLTQPLAGRTTAVPGQFASIDGVVVAQAIALPNFCDVVLAPSDFLPPPADTDVQLTHILFAVRNAAGASVDAAALVNLHVLRTPQD